jgi:hypothetical protein
MNSLIIDLDEDMRPVGVRGRLVRDGQVLAEVTNAMDLERLLANLDDPPLSRWPQPPAPPAPPAPLVDLGGQGRPSEAGRIHETQAAAAIRYFVIGLLVAGVVVGGLYVRAIIRGAF